MSASPQEILSQVRKPYTITKQRERWTEDEHQKFLEALKLYGRAWRRIEEHIGTKTAVQIRSHAQKFFSKLEREASNGGSAGKQQDIDIPPPRPKRKPSHPYPRKAGGACLNSLSPMDEEGRASPVACPESSSTAASSVPTSVGSCQPAAFAPYIAKGGPVLDANTLHNSALGSTYFLGPEGRIKLFGKTVLLPTSQKTAVHEDFKEIAIKEKVHQGFPARERMLPASTQTGKTDLKHKRGFVPYVKLGKKLVSIPGDALSSDINAFGSGISTLEDTGESNVEIPCMPFVEVQRTTEDLSADGKLQKHLDTNLQCLSKRHSLLQEAEVEEFPRDVPDQTTNNETSQMSRDSCQNMSNKDCFSHSNPAAANIDRQFSAMLAPQNNATYLWMDSLFHYYGRLPVLSLAACSPTDGQSNNPSIPWNFLQVAAMTHPAAYAAAIATAGWARSVSGGQTRVANDVYSVPTSLNNVSASAFTAAAASWWAMRGLIPPGFVHPPAGIVSKCADDPDSVANLASGTFVQNVEILDDTIQQEQEQEEHERISDPATDDEAAISENNTEPKNAFEDECIEKNKPKKENSTLKIRDTGDFCSSATAAPGEISIEEKTFFCETKNQCKVEMPYIFPEVPLSNNVSQEVEKAKSARERGQQSPCSADEVNAGNKIPREGSSNGSNSTMFRHHSSESETLIASENGVKGKDDASTKHNTCDATGHCHQENQLNGSCCPKMRFKHLEKGRKYQHRDFRHGDDDNVKRFKSCAHDTDMRKEVSQEGRKAFQALFTCRTLPQTFSSGLSTEDKRNSPGILEQDVLMDSVTIDVEGASCLLTQSERAGNGGVESCRSLPRTINNEQKEVKHGEAHLSGYANVVGTSTAYTEMGIPARSIDKRDGTEKSVKCHYLSISKEVRAKIFSVGSRFGRSGFVPYQRPLTKIKANPHFATSTFDKKDGSSGSGVQKVPDIAKGFS